MPCRRKPQLSTARCRRRSTSDPASMSDPDTRSSPEQLDRPDPPRNRRRRGPSQTRNRQSAAPPSEPADPESAAHAICLRLLSHRARSRSELTEALRRRHVPEDVIGAVLDGFTDVGLIDDPSFAAAWVASRQRTRGLARRALAGELQRRGIDRETSATALEQVSPESEADTARELVRAKLARCRTADVRGHAGLATARRLASMLARKGYPSGLAYRITREEVASVCAVHEFGSCEEDGGDADGDGA